MKAIYIIFLLMMIVYTNKSENLIWKQVDSTKVKLLRWDTVFSSINYRALDYNNKKNIIAVGNSSSQDPSFVISTNTGDTWKLVYVDTTRLNTPPFTLHQIIDVAYPDTTTCVAVGQKGYYYVSKDNCMTWMMDTMKSNKTINNLNRVAFFDSQYGGMASEDQFFLTTDGGYNWASDSIKLKNIPDSSYLVYIFDLQFVNEQTIIMLIRIQNYRDCIIISEDFGKTWSISSAIPNYCEHIQFINKDLGWLGGRRKTKSGASTEVITYTSDGGKTWKIQLDSLTLGDGVHQLYFLDSMNGIALTYFARIWRTRDGGNHWTLDTTAKHDIPNNVLYDIAFIDTNLIIGGADEGSLIYRYGSPPVGVIEEPEISANISPAYPNPAPAGKEIYLDIELTEPCEVTIETYNSLGIRTAESFSAYMEIGKHKFSLNSAELSSGAYFIKLTFNGKNSEVRKAVVW